MDCLRSFNFSASANSNFSPANNIQGWTIGTNNYFVGSISLLSTINITGYKNINVHGIYLSGLVTTLPTAPILTKCLVEDWNISVRINGQMPIIGNQITVSPNQWNMNTSTIGIQNYRLGKYNTKVEFGDPIQSVTSIDLNSLEVSGIGNESLVNQNLTWFLNFTVYYKFEGE
jgi:hypothetical protein